MTTEVRPQPVELEQWPQMPPVALKLWEAREWLKDESHWQKGTYGSRQNGSTCAVGATGWHETMAEDDVVIALAAAISSYPAFDAGQAVDMVATYNDAPATTHADILALFDRAIDLALKEESTHDR